MTGRDARDWLPWAYPALRRWQRQMVLLRRARWPIHARFSSFLASLGEQDRLRVGPHTHLNGPPRITVYFDPPYEILIGAYCSIAAGVEFILGGNHNTKWISTHALRSGHGHPVYRGPISIGNDVWIGKNTTILEGVTIGDGAVVGANTLVADDVRAYAIVVGNPGRELRRRFDDEAVEALLAVAWWRWSHEEVLAAADLINGMTVEAFLAYAKQRNAEKA